MKVGETYQPEMSEFFKKWARMSPGLRGDPSYSPEVKDKIKRYVKVNSISVGSNSTPWCAGTVRIPYGDSELKHKIKELLSTSILDIEDNFL